jgi:hypothetical protein
MSSGRGTVTTAPLEKAPSACLKRRRRYSIHPRTTVTDTRSITRTLAWIACGLTAAVIWLSLLLATDFSPVAVAPGLLVMLALLK